MVDFAKINDTIKKQNHEYDALEKLQEAYTRIQQTAVVDDDFPRVKFRYEQALQIFLNSCKMNGRSM